MGRSRVRLQRSSAANGALAAFTARVAAAAPVITPGSILSGSAEDELAGLLTVAGFASDEIVSVAMTNTAGGKFKFVAPNAIKAGATATNYDVDASPQITLLITFLYGLTRTVTANITVIPVIPVVNIYPTPSAAWNGTPDSGGTPPVSGTVSGSEDPIAALQAVTTYGHLITNAEDFMVAARGWAFGDGEIDLICEGNEYLNIARTCKSYTNQLTGMYEIYTNIVAGFLKHSVIAMACPGVWGGLNIRFRFRPNNPAVKVRVTAPQTFYIFPMTGPAGVWNATTNPTGIHGKEYYVKPSQSAALDNTPGNLLTYKKFHSATTKRRTDGGYGAILVLTETSDDYAVMEGAGTAQPFGTTGRTVVIGRGGVTATFKNKGSVDDTNYHLWRNKVMGMHFKGTAANPIKFETDRISDYSGEGVGIPNLFEGVEWYSAMGAGAKFKGAASSSLNSIRFGGIPVARFGVNFKNCKFLHNRPDKLMSDAQLCVHNDVISNAADILTGVAVAIGNRIHETDNRPFQNGNAVMNLAVTAGVNNLYVERLRAIGYSSDPGAKDVYTDRLKFYMGTSGAAAVTAGALADITVGTTVKALADAINAAAFGVTATALYDTGWTVAADWRASHIINDQNFSWAMPWAAANFVVPAGTTRSMRAAADIHGDVVQPFGEADNSIICDNWGINLDAQPWLLTDGVLINSLVSGNVFAKASYSGLQAQFGRRAKHLGMFHNTIIGHTVLIRGDRNVASANDYCDIGAMVVEALNCTSPTSHNASWFKDSHAVTTGASQTGPLTAVNLSTGSSFASMIVDAAGGDARLKVGSVLRDADKLVPRREKFDPSGVERSAMDAKGAYSINA